METKKKSRWPLILGIFVAAFALSRLASNDKPASPVVDHVKEDKEDREKALAAILKEPKVKDAAITEANVLYAQVIDNRTNRNGYAMYLCQVLNDHSAGVDRVKVVAVGSQNSQDRDNAFGRLLGECWCNDYSTPKK